MIRDQRKNVPPYVGGAYYNRGVLTGAVLVEGIRLAIQTHGLPVTGDKVRKGYEAIKNFDLEGLLPPITLTPQDHEGGGYVRMYQVKGHEWVPVSGWIRGYRDEVMALVKKANNK
jgi:branched-chain amino acid transport system substrate-binding protein